MTAPVDDGLTLLDIRRGTLYHLNRTGAVILAALIDDGGTVESAVTTLVDRYGIGEHQARADMTALVDNLRARGLVTGR
ncbi:MAG: lasso peptide biosynthesis PqqD family chaperone [Pseudonocardiaceae bacterium]